MATSEQLERKAERARERLSNRIADLRSQVSPMTVLSDLLRGVNTRGGRGDDFLPILIKKARNNPIASLLIAAGVGWLLFSEVYGPLSKSPGLTKPRRTIRRGSKKRRTARNSKAAAAVRSN
jgi:hypothetical protein